MLPIKFCSFGLGILHSLSQWHRHNCDDMPVGCPVLVVDKKNFRTSNAHLPDNDHLRVLAPPLLLPICNPCKSTSWKLCEVENYAPNSWCHGLDLVCPSLLPVDCHVFDVKDSILWQFCCTFVYKKENAMKSPFFTGKYNPCLLSSMEDRRGIRWCEFFPQGHSGYHVGRHTRGGTSAMQH